MNAPTSRPGRWRKAPVQVRVDDTLRGAVLAVWLRAFGGRHKVMGDVIRTVLLHRAVQDVHRRFAPAALRVADRLITVTGGQGHPSLTPELRFVLGHALLSSVRAALLDEPALIARPAFEDALVRLALGLLPTP